MSGGAANVLRAVRFVCLFSTGLLAALLFEFWAFTAPALASLPGPAFAQVTQAIDLRFLIPIPYLYIVVDLSGLAVVALLWRPRRSIAFALGIVSLVATLLGTASTLLVNVPINQEVLTTWSAQAPPPNWAEVRDRWDQAHAFRTAMVVLAFASQLLAVLLPADQRSSAAD